MQRQPRFPILQPQVAGDEPSLDLLRHALAQQIARADVAEARVSELERELVRLDARLVRVLRHAPGGA